MLTSCAGKAREELPVDTKKSLPEIERSTLKKQKHSARHETPGEAERSLDNPGEFLIYFLRDLKLFELKKNGRSNYTFTTELFSKLYTLLHYFNPTDIWR